MDLRPLVVKSIGSYLAGEGLYDWHFRRDQSNGMFKLAAGFTLTLVASAYAPALKVNSLMDHAAPVVLSYGVALVFDGMNARQNGLSRKVAISTGATFIAFAVYCFYKGYVNLPVDAITEGYVRSPAETECIDTLNKGFGALPPNVLTESIGKVLEYPDHCMIQTSANNYLYDESKIEWYHLYEPLDKREISIYSPGYGALLDKQNNCNPTILDKATELCKTVLAEGFGGIPRLNLSLFKEISTSIDIEHKYAECDIRLSKEAAKLFNANLLGNRWFHHFIIKLANNCFLRGNLFHFMVERDF